MPFSAYAASDAKSISDLLETEKQVIVENVTEAVNIAPKPSKKKLDIGRTGLPIPRFVTLKRDEVNVRKGPKETFDIAWKFKRKHLPVEIIAEYDNWRKIRDHFGEEGWVFHSLLSSARYGLVKPWEVEGFFTIHNERNENSRIVAKFEAGVLARIKACDGTWCQITKNSSQGYIKQEFLWGAYVNEKIK
ncbi:MAG: hypothetical protein HRU28_00985 [Rhizobiales bacterium]|nr:hypothetical protein [Hyphomicrobiales bacterium]